MKGLAKELHLRIGMRHVLLATIGVLVAVLGNGSSLTAAGSPAWPTYQHDAGRSGVDTTQSTFTAPTAQWTTVVDGGVYAQPLFFNNQVLAATVNNTVYALDPSTGAVVWSQHLGTPVGAGALPCGNFDPVGITATPVTGHRHDQ